MATGPFPENYWWKLCVKGYQGRFGRGPEAEVTAIVDAITMLTAVAA